MRGLPPILVALAVAAVGWALLALPVRSALGELAVTRGERARVVVHAAIDPVPAIARDQAIAIGSRAAATRALEARVRALAGRGGVLVEAVSAVDGAGLARIRLRASGSERAVVAFADALERGRPLARFDGWSIAADGASVRLEGEVAAPWR
ncbi:hypothetical protein M9980_08360 [Sphingomonas donggukensis]|uniref:Type II secretion system protein M n=1 Tax=Sphingomonas donggukensis TaxID=2949093 RepID=A0ABY4TRL4_9SPHN|nr:hypothetical protein [Sphingomonas donggukensis]URW74589.1 hypothetical protein M9980_08360 [Sphingomonas donggukensis]